MHVQVLHSVHDESLEWLARSREPGASSASLTVAAAVHKAFASVADQYQSLTALTPGDVVDLVDRTQDVLDDVWYGMAL